MSLTPTIYSSTDSGAPVLTGEAGKLVALLQAILVDGYGSKASLGWTRPYSGTNKAMFRNDPVLGSGYHTRVDDANTYYTLMRGYQSVTDIDTGDANPVPTVAQWTNGIAWIKSRTSNATTRPWWAIGNARSAYLFIDVNSDDNFYPNFIGDIDSMVAGDTHNYFLSSSGLGTYAGSTGTGSPISMLFKCAVSHWAASMSSGFNSVCGFIARARSQVPGATLCDHVTGEHTNTTSQFGAAGPSYPYEGRLLYRRGSIREAANAIRGFMPGLIVPMHNRPLNDLATLSSVPGQPAGCTLLAKNFSVLTSSAQPGQVMFQTGVDW